MKKWKKPENNDKEDIEKRKNNEFKKYLKEVAEKGLGPEGKEKLKIAKEQAHKRETEKYGKEYADRSYKMDDDGR